MQSVNFTIFLDRDGVINIDSPDYIKCADEFDFIPGSSKAIAMLNKRGFDVIVITNQSGIARNLFSYGELEAIFEKMREGVIDAGGVIKDIFFCPHRPEEECSCRKPLPGLILQAIEKYGIDPAKSCMVGDSIKDIECARNAGCTYAVLVRTGNGQRSESQLKDMAAKKNDNVQDLPVPAITTLTKIDLMTMNRTEIPFMPDFIANDLMEAAYWISGNPSINKNG